jgi:membrane-bound serine protease (ClpP class)
VIHLIRTRSSLLAACTLALLAGLVCLSACAPRPERLEKPQAIVLRLEGVISSFWHKKLSDEIGMAIERGVPTFIIEFDTPGGQLVPSWKLGDYIFERRDKIKIVAYVRSMAYSGGTLVALACDSICIHEASGRIGDVAPVDEKGQIVGEKAQSPVRESLRRYGRGRYPKALVEAMVTPEREVWALAEEGEDGKPGEVTYVTGKELQAMRDAELTRYGEPKQIVAAGELLTVGAHEAAQLGLATVVKDDDDLFAVLRIDKADVEEHVLTRSEQIIAFLDPFGPALIAAGVVLLFIEVGRAGFGLPGILSLICFGVFFVTKISLHYAGALELVLFAAGLVLLLLEIFIIPGFGWAGLSGIVLVLTSLVLAFHDYSLPGEVGMPRLLVGALAQVLGSFAAAVVVICLIGRYLQSIPYFSRLVLATDLREARAGSIQEQRVPDLAEMAGREGTAITALRPAGSADFDGVLLDVVTDGDFVEKGSRIRILEVHGSRVVVGPLRRV